jgi:hypothetical protein
MARQLGFPASGGVRLRADVNTQGPTEVFGKNISA